MRAAVLALAIFVAGAALTSWLVEAFAHTSTTCTHTQTVSEHWKVVMFSTYGDPDETHDHGYRHYYRSDTNPDWQFMHRRVRLGCPGH